MSRLSKLDRTGRCVRANEKAAGETTASSELRKGLNTVMVAQRQSTINPVLATIASAMRVEFAADAAAIRAVDRAVDHLASGLAYEFDGVELRITSYSRRDAGMVQVSDAIGCTCESNRRPWCWHRIACRLLMAHMVITQPGLLRARILEQVSPLDLETDGGYDEYGDFLQELPVASRPKHTFAELSAAADSLF